MVSSVDVYANDSASDWLELSGGVRGFAEHIHEKWDELGIEVYKDNKKIKVRLDFSLEHDTLHQLLSLEQGILVWCDIVIGHRIPIYSYEWYGAITTLRRCSSNTIWLIDWSDDELDERLRLFDEYIRQLRQHAKDGYIIDKE